MPHEKPGRVVLLERERQQILRDRARLLDFAAHQVRADEPVQDRNDLRHAAELLAQFQCPVERHDGLGGAEAFRRNRGICKRLLQLQFGLETRPVLRQLLEKLQGGLKVGDRFHEGRPLARLSAGLEPVIDCRAGLARLREVVCDNLRRALGDVDELACQRLRDAQMQGLPFAAQHARVGGFLHQRVLERVCLDCAEFAPRKQPGFAQEIDAIAHLLGRQRGGGLQQVESELTADRR